MIVLISTIAFLIGFILGKRSSQKVKETLWVEYGKQKILFGKQMYKIAVYTWANTIPVRIQEVPIENLYETFIQEHKEN